MRIVNQGNNPYIMQGCCKTCETVVEVDIRTDCKSSVERKEWTDSFDPDQRTIDERWIRVITTYYLACPVCSERIVAHVENDDSSRYQSNRRRY